MITENMTLFNYSLNYLRRVLSSCISLSSSGLTGAGAGAGLTSGFETGAGFEEATEAVLSAGGSETADDTGSAELISKLILSAAEDAAGCDETVPLCAKVLFGVFFAA